MIKPDTLQSLHPEATHRIPTIISKIDNALYLLAQYNGAETERQAKIRELQANSIPIPKELKTPTVKSKDAILGEQIHQAQQEVSSVCTHHFTLPNKDIAESTKEMNILQEKIIKGCKSQKKAEAEAVAVAVGRAIRYVLDTIGSRRSWDRAKAVIDAVPEVLQSQELALQIYEDAAYNVSLKGPLGLEGAVGYTVKKLLDQQPNSTLTTQQIDQLRHWDSQLNGASLYTSCQEITIKLLLETQKGLMTLGAANEERITQFVKLLPPEIQQTIGSNLTKLIGRDQVSIEPGSFGVIMGQVMDSDQSSLTPEQKNELQGIILGMAEQHIISMSRETDKQLLQQGFAQAAKMLQSVIGYEVTLLEAKQKRNYFTEEFLRILDDNYELFRLIRDNTINILASRSSA